MTIEEDIFTRKMRTCLWFAWSVGFLCVGSTEKEAVYNLRETMKTGDPAEPYQVRNR